MSLTRLVLIILSAVPSLLMGQTPLKGVGANPIYYIDSVKLSTDEMLKVNPNTVTLINAYSKEDALEVLGIDAKDGVVYVETIIFVKRRYWDYFKAKASDLKLGKKIGDYTELKFILNDIPLSDIDVGKLHIVNDETLEDFKIVKRKELKSKYKVKDKRYGVVIKANTG